MPKKKGNLKTALQGHFAQQEQKARQRAAQDAARRKALSVTKSADPRSKGTKHKQLSALNVSKHIGSDNARTGKQPGEAQQDVDLSQTQSESKRRKKLPQPFARDDTILIVGEANFSFTLSLLLPPRAHPPSQILATAYDSEHECFSKYPDARENVDKIRRIAGRHDIVLFGVDAGQLAKYKQVTGASKAKSSATRNLSDGSREVSDTETIASQRRWSKIWFGFPHVGAGHKDETRNVLANQLLILRFLISAAPYLTVGPLPSYAPGGASNARKVAGSDDEDELDMDPGDADDASGFDDTLLAGSSSSSTDADRALLDDTQARISALQRFQPPSRQGSVLITLRNASPYTLWDVANLAKRLPQMLPVIASTAPALPKGVPKPTLNDLTASGLSTLSPNNLHSRAAQPKHSSSTRGVRRYRSYHLWRSFEFDPTDWRGYQHRRTIGWIQGVSSDANEDLLRSRHNQRRLIDGQNEANLRASKAGGGECRTWEFGLG